MKLLLISLSLLLNCGNDSFSDNFTKAHNIKRISSYWSTSSQCDANPCISASGKNICKSNQKIIAVSQDIVKTFPLGSKFYLEIEGHYSHLSGEYYVEDVMNKRYINSIDIYRKDKKLIDPKLIKNAIIYQ